MSRYCTRSDPGNRAGRSEKDSRTVYRPKRLATSRIWATNNPTVFFTHAVTANVCADSSTADGSSGGKTKERQTTDKRNEEFSARFGTWTSPYREALAARNDRRLTHQARAVGAPPPGRAHVQLCTGHGCPCAEEVGPSSREVHSPRLLAASPCSVRARLLLQLTPARKIAHPLRLRHESNGGHRRGTGVSARSG
ncbi:hypothetical protein MRX96_038137 [Rhipicephalus microplus]